MPTAWCLDLERGENVDMCTNDNRPLHTKCTKLQDDVPCIDILPRMRYVLRVLPCPTDLPCGPCADAFFTYGLLVIPHIVRDDRVESVVVCNMGDRAVCLTAGSSLLNAVDLESQEEGSSADSPCSIDFTPEATRLESPNATSEHP